MKNLFQAVGLLWLRVLMGAAIASHGYPKIFSGGAAGLAEGVEKMGLPFPLMLAWAAALAEFLGGILCVLGLGTRIAALFILVTMSVAVFVFHAADPFKVRELALAYWTMAGAVVLLGPGPVSFDALWSRRKPAAK